MSQNLTNGINGEFPVHKVLYIEDNAPNAKLVAQVYKKRPQIALSTVTTAEQGMELIKQQGFDLILMDINLPGINGFVATERLRSEGFGAPILAISANALPADIEYALNNGFNGYLTKPVNILDLLAQTDKALGICNDSMEEEIV